MGLLVGAKTLNVSVPFLFKYAVDTLNMSAEGGILNLSSAPDTVLTYSIALLLGCKLIFYLSTYCMYCFLQFLSMYIVQMALLVLGLQDSMNCVMLCLLE